jgi:hypothetical protein
MTGITLNFYDSQAGRITDPIGFMTADADVKRMVIVDWTAHNARLARTFEDKVEAFLQDRQVGYAFLTPQLHRIEAEVYMTKYPSFDIRRFMPVDSSGDMWDIGTIVYSMASVGEAQFISGAAMDMPFASALMDQSVHNFHLAGIGYEWNVQEMQRAAKLGRSLSADKAKAADLAAQRFIYGIAMTGKTPSGNNEKGWSGFTNNANVPTANLPADGTGGLRTFASKTPDQILRDVNSVINAVETGSGETFVADSLALPTSIYNYLANTRVTDTGSTILAYLQANNSVGESLRIFKSRALETAGSGGTTRMVAYQNTDQVIRFHLPGPHRFLPPFQKASMIYEVGGIMNVGGVEVRIPKGMAYRDGA